MWQCGPNEKYVIRKKNKWNETTVVRYHAQYQNFKLQWNKLVTVNKWQLTADKCVIIIIIKH